MHHRTVAVIPRHWPKDVWQRRIPYAHIAWEGDSLRTGQYDTVLIHEDVALNHTWIRVNLLQMAARDGHRVGIFQHKNPAEVDWQ